MRTIMILGTMFPGGKAFDSDAKTLKELAEEVKERYNYDLGDANIYNVDSEVKYDRPDALLPEDNFKITVTPAKSKAGAFTVFDDEEQSYNAKKSYLRDVREEAIINGDNELVELIGYYNSLNKEAMTQKVQEVNQYIKANYTEVTENEDDVYNQLLEIQARLFAIEKKLNIVNEYNHEDFMREAFELAKSKGLI